MAEIKKIDFSRFLQNQVFALHQLLIDEFSKLTDPKVTSVLTPYKSKFIKFDEVLKQGGKSPYSQKLSELDKLQDKAYTGLANQNKTMLNHFNSQKAEIAYQVNIILNKYGNPCRLPYLQEDAVIKNLVQDLEKFDNKSPSEDDRPVIDALDDINDRLEKIGLREWLDELIARNADFMLLYTQRNEEDAAIITGATKQARNETDEAYYIVARRVNSLADLNGDADYLTVINNINQLLDKELATLAAHRTTTAKRNAKKKEEGGKDDSGNKGEDDRPVIE